MKMRANLLTLLSLICAALLLVACGGDSKTAATATDEPPTETPFPTFAYIEPTKLPAFEQSENETPVAIDEAASEMLVLDPKLVDRGQGRYEALECGGCHGENGEGTDKGESLLEFALSEDDFITFVRSGGELGPSHQYSTDRLSNSGSRNLYQYLVSLAQGG